MSSLAIDASSELPKAGASSLASLVVVAPVSISKAGARWKGFAKRSFLKRLTAEERALPSGKAPGSKWVRHDERATTNIGGKDDSTHEYMFEQEAINVQSSGQETHKLSYADVQIVK